MSQNATLTWSGKGSTGHSNASYFGSLPHRPMAMHVYAGHRAGEAGWIVMFNDASLRQPAVEIHPTLEAAKAHAEECLALPISERGLKSLALNAALKAEALCGYDASDEDMAAALELALPGYPEVTAAQAGAFLRRNRAA